jgi:hypothetical protein
MKFDFLTRYNYYSNHNVLEFDYLDISLVPDKLSITKEYNVEIFQYFSLLE